MDCPTCQGPTRKFGRTKQGVQRYKCDYCPKTFIEEYREMRLDREKAIQCLKLLVNGNSVRNVEKITEVHRDTVLHLLNIVGERCEKLIGEYIQNLPLSYVEADEIWGYVQKKERRKRGEEKKNDAVGDAYTFVAIEAQTKLVVAYQLGKRDIPTATKFLEKLKRASRGRFQLSTDGLPAYIKAVEEVFGADIDYAQLVKHYKSDSKDGTPKSSERRYSPGDFTGAKKEVVVGNPIIEKVSTSYVERQNLTMRMDMRRLTRLTNAFSKKWENLDKALALHFAYYNFCRIHQSLRVTPAMEAGITKRLWSLDDLIGATL